LIVLSYHPEQLWKRDVRLCPANGYLLTDEIVPSEEMDIIYELDFKEGIWTISVLYHPKVEHLTLHGCRQGGTRASDKIVKLLGQDGPERERITQECNSDIAVKYKYLKKAFLVPPTRMEKEYFPNRRLRRCPSCLEVVPVPATIFFAGESFSQKT
jgi:hypothetical protein